jgi:hypothetical protein
MTDEQKDALVQTLGDLSNDDLMEVFHRAFAYRAGIDRHIAYIDERNEARGRAADDDMLPF